MAKGFAAGALWGLVVSAVGAGAVSLAVGVAPIVDAPSSPAEVSVATLPADLDASGVAAPEAAAPTGPVEDVATPTPTETPPLRFEDTADAAPVNAGTPPDPARRPAAESDVAVLQTDALDAPDADGGTPLGADATTPAQVPDPEIAAADLPTPQATAPIGGVSVATESPVLPSVQAALPDAPRTEAEPLVTSEPAQPPVPQVPDDPSGLVADPAATPDPMADAVPEQTAEATPAVPEVAEVAATPDASAGEQRADADPSASDLPPSETPEIAADPDSADDPARTAESSDTTEPQQPAAPQPEPEQTVRILPTPAPEVSDPGRPVIGTPAGSLINRDPAVAEGRLPSVGATEADAPTETAAPDQTTSPLLRNAEPVDIVGDDLPRLSIVLIDDGNGPLGPDTLNTFPFPITFALDPATPGAKARMSGYRARGFEVMALASLPDGAQPTDVEVMLSASLDALPDVVAVLENPTQGLQGSRAVSDQVTQILRDSGHGLVMLPKGLNTATALAAREGVPAATVFKDFDGEGQDPGTIRRFLDGAAFRARQDGAVIVLGRLKADTLSALLLWGLQDRASQVALVPVSRVLREAAGL